MLSRDQREQGPATYIGPETVSDSVTGLSEIQSKSWNYIMKPFCV